METTNVTFKNVISATLRADNSGDENRIYDISADVNIMYDQVDNVQNGVAVRRDNSSAVYSFSANNSPHLTTEFSNMDDIEEQADSLRAVAAFIAVAKTSAPSLGATE